MADGVSKCGRKSALSVFFAISVLAFLLCLLSLLSPTWQFTYLENGRTEHHHGLWLDCKRDYSFDYGRTREYYETLYRHDLQGSPFAAFYLPPLQCVYKFDYWIDDEDLYDHDHDENRLQNDAYQHLFLGWKIAALTAVGVAVIFSAISILLGICSFCHRTFICASTVLVTVAAFLSSAGVVVFYIWGNYQDNKVLREENDTTYEQSFGWAFYLQVVGCCLHWFASMLGCCVTSIALSKSRAKLVKIEVTEGDDSKLLSSSASQPFKRSFSAIYRVDSQALRQWERDYMKNSRQSQAATNSTMNSNFKRTSSVPNFSQKQLKQERKRAQHQNRMSTEMFSSTSNITESTRTGSNFTLDTHRTRDTPRSEPVMPVVVTEPTPKLKSALKTPQSSRKALNEDPTYEYLPCPSSMGVSSFLGAGSPVKNDYDSVYEAVGPETYLQPNSAKLRASNSTLNKLEPAKKALLPTFPVTSGSSQSIPSSQPQKTTIIDDVGRPNSWNEEKPRQPDIRTIRERMTIEEMKRSEQFRASKRKNAEGEPKSILKPNVPSPSQKPQLTIRDFGIDLSEQKNGYCTELIDKSTSKEPCFSTPDYRKVEKIFKSRPETTIDEPNRVEDRSSNSSNVDDPMPDPPAGIAINTFGIGRQRSITNLSFRAPSTSAAEVFDRPDSVDLTNGKNRPKTPLTHKSWLKVFPDEVDRSVGSSTIIENDTLSEAGSYAKDAEVRLNIFMKDKNTSSQQDETTV